MTKKQFLAIAVAIAALVALTFAPGAAGQESGLIDAEAAATTTEAVEVGEEASEAQTSQEEANLRHRQEVWISALEWCESSGVKTAVNWYDLDGTASYYSFQFKPGTFRYYGEKYGVIEPGLSEQELMAALAEYEKQRAIVKAMIGDSAVVWTTQFPACVRKLGLPPR